ncbi:MAG: helix-turn-helix domain-containing protein [Candidatus Cybelea sp.]
MENEGQAAGPSDFGTLLRSFRVNAGLSQEALAERAGMSAHGVSALEWGYRRTPQRGTLALLAGALALSNEQRRELENAAARWVLLRNGGRASVTVGLWPNTHGSNLPLSLASFVGRERELNDIGALVREHRLVTLTGSGGIGKTQTALQVATALSNAGAVWFVGLAPISDPSLVPAAIASALHVQQVPNRPLLEMLLECLKNKTLLLILDNCEHVVTQAAMVVCSLLAGCPRIRILATSREPLRAAGEQTYRLPSLSIPSREAAARVSATDAAAYGAIELFCDRARAVDHHFALSDDNAPAVAEICRRLDGIPLAIELAAARVNSLSITALAEKLEDRFRVLTGGERTALPRQQTMRGTIDWSYDLLSAPEQRVFERLSIFAGGCTLTSAEAVCAGEEVARADVVNLISSLVDKSLIVADFDGIAPRYGLFESFRQYAREKLASCGEQEIVAHRHAVVCLELGEQLECAYDTEPDEVWRALADEELDNWRAALRWALSDRGDVVLGQRLVGELNVLWRRAPLEGRHWVESALKLVDPQTPMKVLGRLSYAEAFVAHQLCEYKEELAASERAIARYRVACDSVGIARAQSLAGHALTYLDRLDEAKKLLEQALVAARTADNRQLVAYILRCLADVNSAGGDIVAAHRCVEEALWVLEAMGARLAVARAKNDLSQYELCAGNAELALMYGTEALATFQTSNDMGLVAESLANISGCLVLLARYDEAEERALEALDLARRHQRDVHACWALQRLGAIAALRPQAAIDRAPRAYAQATRILGFVDAHLAALGSARSYAEEQEYDRVRARLRDVLGADEVAELMTEGAVMTLERAVDNALEI